MSFTAKYAGTATVKVTDNVADIARTASARGTLIGKSKITGKGKGDASQQPCVPFTGPGSMTNSKGTKLNFKVLPGFVRVAATKRGKSSASCGRAKVLGGTKVFKKAKGNLKLTGVYDRGQGTFSIKFTGKLTVTV